jgi:hypothetical protein
MFGCRFWASIWFGRRLAHDFGGFFLSNKKGARKLEERIVNKPSFEE